MRVLGRERGREQRIGRREGKDCKGRYMCIPQRNGEMGMERRRRRIGILEGNERMMGR